MRIAEYIFWGSLAVVAYCYVIYPLLIWCLARIFRDRTLTDPPSESSGRSNDDWPMVSLIIAAYREERVILSRLRNAVELDYPADRLEILIGVDGNDDLTGDLVQSFGDSRVRLLQFPVRRGKAAVLNDCVPRANGEILVFSDANTMMDRTALRQMARHFRNSRIGGVCGQLILTDPTTGENVDGVYWKFENFLKRCEARFGGLLGFNGAIYAIRAELYEPLPLNTLSDDFVVGMRIHGRRKKLIYDETAIAREETAPTIESEFNRRTRIGAGAFQSLVWLRSLLHPRFGRVAFTFWSHKVLRWIAPGCLLTAIVANACLAANPVYLRILLVHELFYLTAFVGLWFVHGGRSRRFLKVPGMFVSMNAALLMGFWQWLTGIKGGTWTPTERPDVVDGTSAGPREAVR